MPALAGLTTERDGDEDGERHNDPDRLPDPRGHGALLNAFAATDPLSWSARSGIARARFPDATYLRLIRRYIEGW